MEIEYKARPEDMKTLLDQIIGKVADYFDESKQKTEVLEKLFELRIMLKQPIKWDNRSRECKSK